MTTDELLTTCHRSGVVLEARGGRLHVQARVGTLTPPLREELTRLKPELLTRLARVTFTPLTSGLVVPDPALRLALDLEQRGFKMGLDEHRQFALEPTAELTDDDRAAIRRWRLHLGAIVGYAADALDVPREKT